MLKLFTSESVTPGHPDKLCDQVSDNILDAYLKEDKYARVACETCANKNGIVVEKELTQFTEALKQVFHDSEFYNHLIENLSPFNANFTKETAKIKWETIFDNLLKNRTT